MDDLRLSYSHWGMHSCYTYPLREKIVQGWAWPMIYFGETSYDAKYLHG